jgi:lactate dehydrogenase-like 2-hydroxyacid dehydrogenase
MPAWAPAPSRRWSAAGSSRAMAWASTSSMSPAATAKGILVTNVRDYCTEEVADHAVSLWLALARGLFPYDRATHQGLWRWQSAAPLHRLARAGGGDRVLRQDRPGHRQPRAQLRRRDLWSMTPTCRPPRPPRRAFGRWTKAELLARSDVLMMQVPMTPETRHFLSEAEFRAMKPTALCHEHRPRADHRQPGAAPGADRGLDRRGRALTTPRRNPPSAPSGRRPTTRSSPCRM